MPPSPILKSIKELAEYLGGKLDKVLAAITAIPPTKPTDMRPVVTALKDVAAKIKDPYFDVTIDTSSMEEELRDAKAAIQGLQAPDLGPIEHLLTSVADSIKENTKILTALGPQLIEAIAGIELAMPPTLKLDEMQLRSIRSGGSDMRLNGDLTTATRISNTTLSAASASSEYSYTFPGGTIGWLIKLRDQGTLAYYSWTTGKLPTSGDGTTYLTIPQNFLRSQEGVDYSGKTIYLGAESASQIFEIELFRL